MNSGTKKRLVVTAMVAAIVVSACSSSSKSSSSSSSSTAAGSATTAAAAAATTTVAQPTGTPIKVAALLGELTKGDNNAGVQAAVKAVNSAGGINGHLLQVTTCSDNNDANTAGQCARTAANDSSVLATVDNSTSYGTNVDPIEEQAGMAAIGVQMFSTADTKSKIVFESSSGIFNSIASAKAAVTQLNAKKIGVPYVNVPAGAQLAPFITLIVKPLGGQVVGAIPVDPTAADITSQVANEIAANPDVIIDGLTLDQYTKFIRSTRQQGSKVPFMVSSGVFDAAQVQSQLAGVNDNIYMVDEYDHQSQGFQEFLSDMQKYNSGYGNRNDSVLSGWIAIKMFAYAAEHATDLTRAAILTEMNGLSTYTGDGLLPGLDFTKPQTGLGGALPRLVNDSIYIGKYNNGKEDPVGTYQAVHLLS